MRLLVRKIQKSKWMQNDILNGEPVSGDAITNCLKTKNNTISTWGIMSEDKIEQAVLAIVSAHQHIDTIDVVILEKENIEKKFNLKNEPGNTPVKDLVDTHIDICGINYNSLGELAQAIVDKFKENKVFRFTRKQIKDLLITAVKSGRLNLRDLHDNIKEKLEQKITNCCT